MVNPSHYIRDRKRLLLIYFIFYYAILLGFLFDHRLLSQYDPIFFNYNRDLTELALIATGLPRWMVNHPFSFTVADVLAFVLPLPVIWREWRGKRPSPWPALCLAAGLALYLLLADIFWQMHFEPFVLIFLLAVIWTTGSPRRFYLVLEGCRYYFLYIFVSAAVWKLARGAVFNAEEMSRILLVHHSDLLTGDCTSLACRGYTWLIGHPALSQALYIAATLLEACFLVGLFTRRFDRWLIGLTVVFVVADWVVMRIPYWTILIGVVPLWIRDLALRAGRKGRKIAFYETTHHENLPALLDLAESRFDQVALFLKERSYHNLVGGGSPGQRWPQTEFYIQTAGCSNRRFIRQLFTYVRRHGVTHLHFGTLDNNLLIIAVRLWFLGPIHLSLTVHEVNEYFSRSMRDVRDATETLAKALFRRMVRHYHVFLPAMTKQIRERIPRSTAVFIPSRFYSGHLLAMVPPLGDHAVFRIVLPGSVDPARRDYDSVFESLRFLLASPATPTPKLELVLLGDTSDPAASTIIKSFQADDYAGVEIRTFLGYIQEKTYEEVLTHAHLIWSPLRIQKTGSRATPETYGLTTASGLTADLLLNNAPALVPVGFDVPEEFDTAVIHYGSPKEAAQIILRLAADPAAYAALREQIHKAFAHISKDNFNRAFDELMGE